MNNNDYKKSISIFIIIIILLVISMILEIFYIFNLEDSLSYTENKLNITSQDLKNIRIYAIEIENDVNKLTIQNNELNIENKRLNHSSNYYKDKLDTCIEQSIVYYDKMEYWKDRHDFTLDSFTNNITMYDYGEMIGGLYNNKHIHVYVTDDIEKNLETLCHESLHDFIFEDYNHFCYKSDYEGVR